MKIIPPMRQWWLIMLVVVLVSARVTLAENKNGKITIAAYNVEFMLDVYDDPYTHDEGHPPKPRKDIELVCKAVRAANPDVITFEEVENEGIIKAAVHEFLPDMGYEYIAADRTNSDRGQNLGILSRKPILSMTSHRFLPLKLAGQPNTWHFGRDLWKVVIQATPTKTVTFFVVHLKSKYESPDDPHSTHWREAEVTAARKIIGDELTANPNELAIMLGDFNDTPESEPLHILLAPKEDQSPFLVDVHSSLPATQRISYLHTPYRSTIDYMLASPALAKRLVPNSADIVRDKSVLDGSDHAPIFASFELGE